MMVGFLISTTSYVYGDIMSVVHYTSRPATQYAIITVAMGEFLVGHIPSKENIADLKTKSFWAKKRK